MREVFKKDLSKEIEKSQEEEEEDKIEESQDKKKNASTADRRLKGGGRRREKCDNELYNKTGQQVGLDNASKSFLWKCSNWHGLGEHKLEMLKLVST